MNPHARSVLIALAATLAACVPPDEPLRDGETLAPEIEIQVVHQRIETPVRRALSNSFAFGGNNVNLLVEAP